MEQDECMIYIPLLESLESLLQSDSLLAEVSTLQLLKMYLYDSCVTFPLYILCLYMAKYISGFYLNYSPPDSLLAIEFDSCVTFPLHIVAKCTSGFYSN